MSKELTLTQEQKELQEVNEEMSNMDWGVKPEARNIIIPKIMLMQGLSEAVTDGKAKLGDLYESVSKKILGGIDSPKELIPFYITELWYISKVTGADKDEFDRVEPMTPENASWSYSDVEDGQPIKRTRVMQVYFLDPENLALPIYLSFKNTSLRSGKELYTMMYFTNIQEGKFPPSYAINLSSVKDKNDKGTFAKFSWEKGRLATADELRCAAKWLKTIKSGQTKDDSIEEPPSSRSTQDTSSPAGEDQF